MGKKQKQRKYVQPREHFSIDKMTDIFLPYWRISAVEQQLRDMSSEGYRLVYADSVGYASWRFYFTLGSPQSREYYIATDKTSVKDSPYRGLGQAEAQILAPFCQRIVYDGTGMFIGELSPEVDAAEVENLRVKKMHAALNTCTGSLLFIALPAIILFFVLLSQGIWPALILAAAAMIPIVYHIVALFHLLRGMADVDINGGKADWRV